ncbi:MAG: saccharopine dehydrogenase [Halomonadaceae bacterium]|nr:MAG: saccharopine dehydrogenase [Halomonadaceae bacterium]
MSEPRYDLVIFGATSFVGQILTRYLLGHLGKNGELKWAIAGRSEKKLQDLRRSLGNAGVDIPMIKADAADEEALKQLCAQTRAVISTVGPYALFGEPLVRECARSGTDYCDLTGEVQWVRRMVDRYEADAKQSGARIVHCCGFDSIPSDLGVYFLQQAAMESFSKPLARVKMRVKAASGEFSGGTVASLMNVVKEASADPSLRKELANPYSICPEAHGFTARQPNVKSAEYDPDFDAWTAPFIMAAINTRVVHRSNALSGNSYGHEFRYDEAMLTGRGIKGRMKALGVAGAMGAFMVGAVIKPTRWALERFVVPKPGEGPSPEAQEEGFYDLRFWGQTDDGQTLRGKVTGDLDPGYGSTAKMLGQAAICMVRDLPEAEREGGFWTPATLFNGKLVTRLQRYSGLEFKLLKD